MLQSVEELPTIPETLVHILTVIDDEDSGPADLSDAVRRDAPLMAKILTLANSPYYSPRGGISDINRCVAVLGYRTVRQLAICVSVATVMFKAMADASGELDYRELWRHSVVTGAIAKHLARLTGHTDPEQVFTAGLLHDIGKFILEVQAPDRYGAVVRERAATNVSMISAERAAFGYDHANLGAAFARAWRFPDRLGKVFGYHHANLVGSGLDDDVIKEIAVVAVADYMSNTLQQPHCDFGFDSNHLNLVELMRLAGLSEELINDNSEDIRKSVVDAASYLSLH